MRSLDHAARKQARTSYLFGNHAVGNRTAGVALAVAILAGTSLAGKAQAPTTAIYPGGSPQSAGVAIRNAGSGTISLDTTHVYTGGGSLKLVTHGLYQGGAIDLNTPYDLGPLTANKNAYVQFAIQPPVPPTGANGSQGTLGGIGKNGGMMPGGGPGGTGSGGKQASNQYNGALGSHNNTATSRFQKASKLENIRIVLVTTTGTTVEKRIPMSYANDDAGWKVLSIPVNALDGITAEDGKVKEVRVYGDTTGTLYLGKIGVVSDTTRIMIEPLEGKTVTANQKYRYTASAHGGASPLVYSWDWDDRDGIQVDSEGRSATHMYRKSGDYNVTVTVTDPFGVKESATTKFQVHVP